MTKIINKSLKYVLLTISFFLGSLLLTIFTANKLSAGSHKLDISIQNCSYAKKFAKTVHEYRKVSRPLSFYEKIDFTSPVAMEIIIEAYQTDEKEPQFSDGWLKRCQEISCNEFWAELDVAIKLISD